MGSSIFVRPSGEADIVLMGPDSSLLYFFATPGNPWTSAQVAGPGSITSNPAIFVRADGEADIVAMGPNGSLMYYWATPGGPWSSAQVAPAGGPFGSLPSLFVRADGEADIVFLRGTSWQPMYYWAMPGGQWHSTQLASTYTFSIPQLHISNMRTGHLGAKEGTDTDYASLSLQVKGYPLQTVTAALGDHGGGDVNVGLSATCLAATGDMVTFQYTVINSSSGASAAEKFLEQIGSDIITAVNKAADQVIQKELGFSLPSLNSQEQAALIGAELGNVILPGGLGAILGAIAGWFASDIVNFAWPDCDGPVAVGLHVWSGAQVQELPLFGTGLAIVEDHPGTNSPAGCGSNSDYQVSWSVTGT